MKKSNLTKMTVIFLIVYITPIIGMAYSGGSGTLGAPYQIANSTDLQQMAGDTGNYDKYFILTANIDLGGQAFTAAIIAPNTSPNGTFTGTKFTGVFDGNGHKITNFTINGGTTCYLGLFGFVDSGGQVQNLGVEGATITGNYAVAGLVGSIEVGSLTDCYTACTVSGTDSVGGMVGYNWHGTITSCHTTGSVSGISNVGGLAAENSSGTLTDCYATGTVTGTNYIGGLVGYDVGTSTLTSCHATGSVTGTNQYVGGLVGMNNDTATITNCYVTGNVIGYNTTGGLVGYNGGSVSNCYSTGNVSGNVTCGGLIGYTYSSNGIMNCYSTGTVSGNIYIGGLVGVSYDTIINCYSTGAVSGTSDTGGLLAVNYGTTYNCFWDNQTSSQTSSASGTGKTTAEMKTLSTFTNAGWDFVGETDNGTDDIWKIADNGTGYPKLSWERVVYPFGTIPGQKNIKLTLPDCDGNNVTFSLTGGGYGEIDACDCNFSTIVLHETTDKSALTISTKGKVYTSVGSIICNGPMKSITAKTAELLGSITIGHSSNPKAAVTIVFNRTDDLDIHSEMPIKSISTFDWTGSLTAPSVGSITTTSNPKLDRYGTLVIEANVVGTIGSLKVAGWLEGSWNCKVINSITTAHAGDFDLTLSQEPNVNVPALGKLTVKNSFEYSRITSSGNIGTITAGKFWNATCFAGVADACMVDLNTDYVLDLPPVLDGTFNETATIKSIMIKGIKGQDPNFFVNSNIAAKNISGVSIAYPEYNNSGKPFGITMWNNPAKTFTIKDVNGTHSWKGSNIGAAIDWLTVNGGDMQIRKD